MLEQAIIELTAAVKELTGVLKGKKAEASSEVAETGGGKKSAPGRAKPGAESSGSSDKAGKAQVGYPEVAAVITQLAKDKGRDAAIAVLGEFGVKNGKDLKQGDFEAFIEKAKEALQAEEELS